MRVIGGEFRSRLLKSLPGLDVRPTPDRLREALFNVLTPRIHGARFLDIYAGTGAVGIEALSRGASHAIFIESNRAAVNVIRENLRSLGLEARAQVRPGRAGSIAAGLQEPIDIAFVDPPYRLEQEYERAITLLAERSAHLVVAQHATRLTLNAAYGGLTQSRVLKQGDNSLSFYELSQALTDQ
ncbi:MAG: 16S rRNA (guanine(966)-N(2))-methyltransferase RsmD [Bryobacteraceae bacterium]